MSVCHATHPYVILPVPSVCQLTHPYVALSVHHMDMSICCTTSPSVCQSPHKSVALSICNMASPSVIPICPSYNRSIHHPINSSMTCQSVTPPISPAIHLSDSPSPSDHLYTILPRPSACASSSDHSSTIYTSLSDHPSPPDCLCAPPLSPSDLLSMHDHLYHNPPSPSTCSSPSDSLTTTMTRHTICLSSHTIHRTQDSSQSLAVVNGSNPTKPRNSVGPLLTMTYLYMP